MKTTRWLAQFWSLCLGAMLLCVLALNGCGGRESPGESDAGSDAGSSETSSSAGSAGNAAAGNSAGASSARGASNAADGGTGALVQAASVSPRKIIYTAEVALVVENLSRAQEKLARLVRSSQGYISDTTISGESGEKRSGTWKARVPVERYEAFMAGATRLGELQSVRSQSQDVTAEYYDVAARITNKQVEEARLRRHLEQSTGKLSEILQVERELSRVRGEVEEAQGRIRVLANLSSLTTITITLNEIKNYVPPAPPTFGTQVARAFSSSIDALRDALKGLVVLLAALVPWLVVLAVFGLPARFIWRRFAKPARSAPPPGPQPPLGPPLGPPTHGPPPPPYVPPK